MDTQPVGLPDKAFDIERFKKLYHTFDTTMLEQLPGIYSEEIIFKDPIHELQGLTELTQYFLGFCSPDMKCSFQFMNEVVTSNQAFFQWQMNYSHTKLENGRPLTLTGGSLIRFNNKIIYHEDFYDMGAMIYQHIPVLGWIIKKVNSRLIGNETSKELSKELGEKSVNKNA